MNPREKVFLFSWGVVAAVLVVSAAYNIGSLHGGSRAIATFCAGEDR